jgi:hypothetical protein
MPNIDPNIYLAELAEKKRNTREVVVHSITASNINSRLGVAPVVALGCTFEEAVQRINQRLSNLDQTNWMYLELPQGDASVIRSTPIGSIMFTMEQHRLEIPLE